MIYLKFNQEINNISVKFDKKRIHRLFLKEGGNIRAVMGHKDTPKSPNTIKRYVKNGRWHEELPSNSEYKEESKNKSGNRNKSNTKELRDINRLERVKKVINEFLVPSSPEKNDSLKLKPKTYTEAVKCYLDIDSRIEQKKGKSSDSNSSPWEEIMRQVSSDE